MCKICLYIEIEEWTIVKDMTLLEKSFVETVDQMLEGILIQKGQE